MKLIKSLRFVTFAIVLASGFSVQAVVPLVLDDELVEYFFSTTDQTIDFYEDTTGTLEIEDILNDKIQEQFQYSDERYVDRHVPQNHHTKSAYWLRVRIRHTPATENMWIFEFANQTVDHIGVYVPNAKGGYDCNVIGDTYHFAQRKFNHKNNEVVIPNKMEGMHDYYFQVKSDYETGIVISVRSVEKFVGYALSEYLLFGVFFGMLLVVVVYNLLMFIALREFQFLSYIMYAMSFGLYFASFTGVAFQYLWQSMTSWNQVSHEVALFLVIISGLEFSREFLNVPKNAPKLAKVFRYVVYARTVWFLVSCFHQEFFQWRILELIPLLLVLYAGITTYKNGYKPARFFVLAYSILVVGFVIKAMLAFGFIPHVPAVFYADCIAFSFEMFFLMIALADKVSIIRADREKSQLQMIHQLEENEKLKDKVNRELEEKVQERTIEVEQKNNMLNEANDKLKQQAEEINQMNLMLDLDNRSLKKDIKATLEARILKDSLGFEEFMKVFSDKLACLRFLNEKKEALGFECHKCGNSKFSEGPKKFSRRCTKCGYNESVTAYTVFHGLRFPIEKAFYIFYLTINHGTELTVDELSEKVDLRRNTCWSFRNKVLALMEAAKAKNKRIKIDDYWEEIFDIE